MINKTRRATLKALSGLTATAAIAPGIASASALLGTDSSDSGRDVSMSMMSEHGRWHSVKLTNNSNKAVTLKHVYPSNVIVDGKIYDVNDLFESGPLQIEAGQSHVGVVAQKDSLTTEINIPSGLTQQAFSMNSEYKHFGKTKRVTTTRSFFA